MKKISYNAPFTLTYFFICLLFLLSKLGIERYFPQNLSLNSTLNFDYYFMIFRSSYNDPLFYFRLFSHVIGHKNLTHFMNNFLVILLIGPLLEEKYGSWFLTKFTILNALITGIIFIIFFNNQALMGASGVLFMMIMMTPFTRNQIKVIPFTFILTAILYLGREFYTLLMIEHQASQLTHLVGGIIGIFAAYYKQNTMQLYNEEEEEYDDDQ